MKKRSEKNISYISPATIKRLRLAPVSIPHNNENKFDSSQSSLKDYSISNKDERLNNPEDIELVNISKEEIRNLIQSSLLKYPTLANNIKKLEKEKIPCKCSVFSKNRYSLDRVHGFSTIACASEYCINRILEESDNSIKVYTKSPKYYSLSPEKRLNHSINKELILYEKKIDKIARAVNFCHKHENSENEYQSLYTEYIKSPNIFNIPRRGTRSPNFSMKKPNILNKEL